VRPIVRLHFALMAVSLVSLAACGGTSKTSGGPPPTSGLTVSGSSALCRVAPGQAPRPASTVTVDRNIAYGSSAAQPLLLDAYRPTPAGAPRPSVLVVHGGGWAGGDKADDAVWSGDLAKAGFVAFDANYTLATPGQPGWPRQLQELRAAVHWIRAHAAAYGVDPVRIGALGASAGGNLVELLGDNTTGSCSSGDRVAAVVSWSGPADLRGLETGATECLKGQRSCGSVGLASLLGPLAQRFVGCPSSSCPAKWTDASPISHVSRSTSPMLLFNSAHEVVPLVQVQELSHALAAAAVPQALVVYPGSAHAEAYGDKAMPPSVSFFSRYLATG
jgi:acetyl esterase